MINLSFCEPDPVLFAQLSKLLQEYEAPEPIQIKGFFNPAEFIHYVDHHGQELDIVLCNIIMDAYNGIQLMHTVQKSLPNIQIIFVSQYKEMVFDAYSVRHVAFIPVPISIRHFNTAMRMAVANVFETRSRKYLTLSAKGQITRLDIGDILYLESSLRTIHVQTRENRMEFIHQLEAMKQLLDQRFLHCHKSFLVNMDYITSFDGSAMCFVLSNGHRVPISSRRAAQARREFEAHNPC